MFGFWVVVGCVCCCLYEGVGFGDGECVELC